MAGQILVTQHRARDMPENGVKVRRWK